jgi:4-amino-4-deoxy-L-arabinose transferase-like glycosyltransferase
VSLLTFRRLALLVSLVGALHGLLYAPFVHKHVVTDSWTYTAIAKSIEHGNYSPRLKAGFYYVYPRGWFDLTGLQLPRSAWSAPEREAFRPPGYPAVLAALGNGGGGFSMWTVIVVQAALFGAGVFLLALTVRRWWGERIALGAAALYALDPYSKHYVPLVLTEVLAGFLIIAAGYAFTRAWDEQRVAWWAAAGALVAAATLTRAVFVLAVPLLVLAALLRRPRVPAAVATLACAAVLLVPWLVWTNAVTGKPVFANWGEGFNLLLAARGEGHGRSAAAIEASSAFENDLRSVWPLAPSANRLRADPESHARYLRLADEKLRKRARSIYRSRIENDPQQVAWEFAYRMWFLWNAHEDWYQPGGAAIAFMRAVDWLLLALGAAGALLALRRGGAARAVVLFVLAYTVVLGVHHVEARFAMPVRGYFLALVVLALFALADLRGTATSKNAHSQKGAVAGLPTDVM